MFKFVQIFHSKQNFQRFRLELSRCDKETKTDHGVSKVRARKRHVFYVSYPGKFSKYHSLTVFFWILWKRSRETYSFEKYQKLRTAQIGGWLLYTLIPACHSLPQKRRGERRRRLFPRMEIRAIKYHHETARRALLSFWGHCRRPQ